MADDPLLFAMQYNV